MKLQQEVSLFLDMYKSNSDKLYTATVGKHHFYGNYGLLINTELLTQEETLPILETLDQEDISLKINEAMKTIAEEEYWFWDFNRFNSIGTMKEVWIWRKAIGLKKFDKIKKILNDYDPIIKSWDHFVFYVWSIPFLICSYSLLDIQASLLD